MSDLNKYIRAIFTADTSGLRAGMADASRATRDFSASGGQAMEYLRNRVTDLAMSYGGLRLAQEGIRLAELSNQAQNAERGLASYAGGVREAEAAILAMQRATGGALGEMAAIQTATKLLSLGIADNAAELENYTRNVALVGAAQGLTTAEALDAANRAIANNSIEMLDNLGISSGNVRARIEELQGATAGLSREQAFSQAVMEQLTIKGEELAAAGVQVGSDFDRARVIIADFKLGLGDAILGGINPFMESLTPLQETLALSGLSFRDLGEDAVNLSLQLLGITPMLDNMAAATAWWSERNAAAVGSAASVTSVIDILAAAAAATENPILNLGAATTAMTGEAWALKDAIDQVPGGMDVMGAAFIAAAEDAGYTTEQATVLWDTLYESGPAAAAAVGNMSAAGGAAVAMGNNMAVATRDVWALKDALDALNNERTGNYGQAPRGVRTPDQRANDNNIRANLAEGTIYAMTPGQRQRYLRIEQEQIRTHYKAVNDAREEAERTAREASRRTASVSTGASRATSGAATKAAREQEAAAKKLQREQEKAAKESERAWQAAYNRMSSAAKSAFGTVRSAVSGALDLGFSIGANDDLLDQFGLRVEGPNEIIRRLQDVVNRGGESEWASFYAELLGFTPGVGDEVRARAAALMRDIQGGLRPELIDREALKENARRALRGDLMREQLIDEVAQELAPEFGQDLINRVLGREDFDYLGAIGQLFEQGAADPAGLERQIAAGITGPVTAVGVTSGGAYVDAMISSIGAALEAQQQRVRELGSIMGEWMAEGIASRVAAAIIDLIASEIETAVA